MSFSADVVRIDQDGERVAGFFESEIHIHQHLYDKFKDKFIVEVNRWYDTSTVLDEISKQYTVNMTDYYVSEHGWNVWVDEQTGPINIPLSEITSTDENYYSLRAKTVLGIYDEPSRYKSWIYKHGTTYVVTPEDWKKALSYFPKKHLIHGIERDENTFIFNSY